MQQVNTNKSYPDYIQLATLTNFSEEEQYIVNNLWCSEFHIGFVNITLDFLVKWIDAPRNNIMMDKFYLYLHNNFRVNEDFRLDSNKKIYVQGNCMKYIIMLSESSKAISVIKVFIKFEQIITILHKFIENEDKKKIKKKIKDQETEDVMKLIDIHMNKQKTLYKTYELLPFIKFDENPYKIDYEKKQYDIYENLCYISNIIINL